MSPSVADEAELVWSRVGEDNILSPSQCAASDVSLRSRPWQRRASIEELNGWDSAWFL